MEKLFKPVTPLLKDEILKELLEVGMSPSFSVHTFAKELNIDVDVLIAILDQFESLGFLKQVKCLGGRIDAYINITAHDFYIHGGFYAQEELLKANIEKLNRELMFLSKELEPKFLEKVNTITSLGSAIISALTLFKSH